MTDGDGEADDGLDAEETEPSDDADPNPDPAHVENTTPPPQSPTDDDGETDETVPAVELDLYELSVRVSGQSTDDLAAVESTAKGLMEFLVEHASHLEDRPDDRGLG